MLAMIGTLTQHEARIRSNDLALDSYDLTLDLSQTAGKSATYPVKLTTTFTTTSGETFLDFLGERVESITVDGQPRHIDFDGSRIRLTSLPTMRPVEVTICCHSRYSRTGQGLHRFTDPSDGQTYLYSHSEPSDARRIFPCFDQPDLKARFTVEMITPSGWTALSNQPTVQTTNHGATTTHRFSPTPPLSTYLTCFAVGPWAGQHATWTSPSGQSIECGVWCRASMAEFVDDEFLALTHQGLDFFETNYGFAYPWGKYDSIIVPEYNLGAMENPGLVTFTERYLFRSRPTRAQHAARANTILHEMSHMWFGDLVTPRWWNDLWLKESFAEFMGADASVCATGYREAWVNFAGNRKNWAYLQDQLPTTHPIAAEIPDVDAARQNFDGITYAKGAAVLKQLVHYVGRDQFYAGARDYFTAHAFSSATFDDLLDALAPHTEADLHDWAQRWLCTTGPDLLTPRVTITEGRITELRITASATDALRPHRLDVTLFRGEKQHLERIATLDVLVDPNTPVTMVAEAVGIQAPSLVVLNDNDHTYARVRFDERSLTTLRTSLSRIDEELTRAVVWTALWNLTRDGELSVADYTGIALTHGLVEPNPNLVAQVLANISFATAHFLPHGLREQGQRELADTLWTRLLGAGEGSDLQLALVRAAIPALAASDETSGSTRLREILNGRVPGLRRDPDLRWSVLSALAARGETDPAELEEQKNTDNTMSGAVALLGATHCLPTVEMKARIWELVRRVGAWSNDEVDALLGAWNAPGSTDLVRGWDREFFEVLDEIWDTHPIEIANRLVRGLYPQVEASLTATKNHLDKEIPGALRRVLLECADHLRRDLEVQRLQG